MPHRVAKSRKPRYQQLADDLRVAIAEGQFPGGFPTEQVLTDRYKVSRFTVREALKTLQVEGLISRRRGSGTTIEAATKRGGALHQPLSNVAEVLQYARDTAFDFHRYGDTHLPPAIDEALGIEDRNRWLRWRGIRKDADGQPIALTDVFLHERLEALDGQLHSGAGAIFSQIETLAGVKVASITQDIQAVAAEGERASALGIDEGAPVLRIIRCYLDKAGAIFEISASYHPGDRFAYAVHFEADA